MTFKGADDRLSQLAQHIEGASFDHTGGGVFCVTVPIEGSSFALVSEDYSEEGTFALGIYEDWDDDGAIVKEWDRSIDLDESADIIRNAIITWVGHA